MSSSIIKVKSKKKDPLLDVRSEDLSDVILTEKQSTNFEFDNDNQVKFVDCFSASFNSSESVNLRNTFNTSRSYACSSLAYMIQSKFFSWDAQSNNSYFTHPWTNEPITAVHCISFNHNLFKDKLLGFDNDILVSITGNVFNGGNFLGYASYDSLTLLYTLGTFSLIESNQFVGLNTNSYRIIPQFDELDLDYTIVSVRIYYQTNPEILYYRARGVLMKDYGIVIIFDNQDNWSGWNDANFINASDIASSSGSTTYPAVYWRSPGSNLNISYQYSEEFIEKRVDVYANWDEANYTSNPTARDIYTDQYKFIEIDTLDQLSKLEKAKQPKTYVSHVYLFDDKLNLVGKASLSSPVKKDFLTNLDMKIRIRI